MDWSFLEQLTHGRPLALILTVVAGLLAATAALFKYLSERRAGQIIAATKQQLEDERAEVLHKKKLLDALIAEEQVRTSTLTKREDSIVRLRAAILGSDEELWRMHKPNKPAGYDDAMSDRDPPVLMVANSKGGVGKTTISVNLVAHFSTVLAKRILVVDLDHQGSLSNTLLSAAGITKIKCDIAKVIDPGFPQSDWQSLITPLDKPLSKVDLISASPELAPAENKLLLNYLLQEPGPDGRYLLAQMLNSRAMRQAYSLIILDCPPRLTPAMINGLCAATHLLVPTVLDRLSAEQIGVFLAMTKRLKAVLNPSLDLLGAVAVMTDQVDLRKREAKSKNVAEDQMARTWNNGAGVLERHIPHKAAIQAAAGGAVAYLKDKQVAAWFDQLGREITPRLGLGTIGDILDEGETASRTSDRVSGLFGSARPAARN